MKCREVQNVVSDSDATRAYGIEVREHLQACRECHQHEEDITRLRALLLEPDRVSVPWNFNARLSERIAAERGQRSWWHLIPVRPLAYAASFLMLASLALMVWVGRSKAPDHPVVLNSGNSGVHNSAAVHAQSAQVPAITPPSAEAVDAIGRMNSVKPNSGVRISSRRNAVATRAPEPYMILVRDPSRGERILTVEPVVFGSVPILGANAPRAQAVRYEGTIF